MITKNIDAELNDMLDSNQDIVSQNALLETSDSVFTEETEQVAGLRGLIIGGAKTLKNVPVGQKEVVKDVLKKTLQNPEKEISRDIKVIKPKKTITPNLAPEPTDVPLPPKENEIKELAIPDREDILNVAKTRSEILDQGAAAVSPVPSPAQLIQGIGQGKISTVPYDDSGMRATLEAASEVFVKENESMTIQQLYDNAIQRGLPKRAIKNVLTGVPFESKIGDYQLAKNTAGLIHAMDESTSYLDDLFKRLETDPANFTETDLFNLAQQSAVHTSLMETVLSVGSDTSATMNVFRRAKETMGTIGGNDFRQFLEGVINKDEAIKFARLYNRSSQAGKNKLVSNQKGLLSKLADGAWYTYQSNLLSDVGTWAYNFVGAGAQNSLMISDEYLIAGITSPIRRYVTGAKDGYYMEDVINGIHGLYHGLSDGWMSAAKVIKTGERAGFKSQAKANPWTAENFSNAPLFSTFPETMVTPDLTDTWIGKLINGAGYFHSVPFRMLAAGDEVTSTGIAQVALNREVSAFGRLRYNELKQAGKTDEDINKILTDEIDEFRESQPIDIYKNVEETRELANLSYAWDKTRTMDRAYSRIESALQAPVIKTFIPFAPTLTRVFDQAASRVPGMQIISPQFYKDVSRGGVYADRAAARVISGGIIPTMMVSTSVMEGKVTGGGPIEPNLKKSLEATGWQEYSFVWDKGTISDENLAKVKTFLNVTESTDKVYISYKRLDQVGQIFASSADFGESLKMYNGKPDDEDWQKYGLATAAYISEFTSELPLMTVVSDLISAGMGKYEDKGEKFTEVMQKLAEATGKRAAMSVPFLGYAAGTQSAHIARLIDNEQRSKMPDTMAASDARTALEKIKNDLQGRIPLMRGDVEMELDYLGRPVIDKATVSDAWINGIPFVKAKQTQRNEVDEFLVQNKYGFPLASKTWDGVTLNAEQYNQYKKLYGQEIKMPQPVYKDNNIEYQMINLESAIIQRLNFVNKVNEISGNQPLFMSERHAEIDKVIGEYRDVAKRRMLGDVNENGKWVYYETVFKDGNYDVIPKEAAQPDLRNKIDEYKLYNKVKPVGEPLI